jgi:hypothetical protein
LPVRVTSTTVLGASSNTSGVAANGELTWITSDYDAALRQAKAENKLVFVDFTGYTSPVNESNQVEMFACTMSLAMS